MSSVYNGDHGSPPVSQQDLKEAMHYELNGQIWEFAVERLAQALSAKTRKPSASKLEQFDTLENYDLAIDKLDLQINTAFHHFVHNKPETLLVKSDCPESEHHRGLIDFLNSGIRSSFAQLPKDHEALYRELKFYVWDRPMKDAKSLKPDGAGVLGFKADELDNLFWSPPAEGGEQMAIPVETRDNWPDLVLHAGSYACCLFSASPLRQFVLVIGYNYKDHTLRFLVYHRGGCTSSEPLNLDQPKGQKVYLPGRKAGDNHPLTVDVDHILRYSSCIWGRAPRVFCIGVPVVLPVDEENPVEDLIPDLQHMEVQKNAWQISDTAGHDLLNPTQSATGSAGTETSGLSSSNLIHTVSSIVISRARALTNGVENVDHAIDWYPLDPLELKRGDSAVLKLCWVPDRVPCNLLMEPRLLRDCSGMFGVPKHLYSFRAHHKASCQTTNHLFLPSPAVNFETFRWDLWGKTNWEPDSLASHSDSSTKSKREPEYLSLLGHVTEFVGHSLESAKDLRSLVRAVLHAHLGYYNMIQKNYQHCDLSIGNVRMVDEPIKTERFDIPNPNETQREILDLCRNLGINDHCNGFVIDGDLAVDWDRHFTEENLGTKSGTSEFMSSMLLDPLDKNYVHSPVDDYYSLYFLTQWACIFRDLSPEDKPKEPQHLQQLRSELAGNVCHRDAATCTITGIANLTANRYGAFLPRAQQFLRDWNDSFPWINEWGNLAESQVFTNATSFRNIAGRGLLSFLHVVNKSKLLL
ncbi:hypothetical protein GGU11DRAFT_812332 [Lentinula aff. detonsa]|nr:hypothetical protein GGU11DRAFT_812332 [Lentinula aff. detonsa]